MISLELMTVFVAYGIISVAVYARVIKCLLFDSQFQFLIFRIMGVLGCFDLIHYFINIAMFRLPLCPVFDFIYAKINSPSRVLGVQYFLIFFIAYMQYGMHLVIVVIRFIAIVLPLQYDKKRRRVLPYVITGSILLSLLPTWQLIFCTVAYKVIETTVGKFYLADTVEEPFYHVDQFMVLFCMAITFMVLCLGFNIMSLFQLCVHVNQQKDQNVQQAFRGAEKGMTSAVVVMIFFQLLNAMYHTVLVFYDRRGGSENKYTVLQFLPFFSDLNDFHAPYVLLFASERVRQCFVGRMLNQRFFNKPSSRVGVATLTLQRCTQNIDKKHPNVLQCYSIRLKRY